MASSAGGREGARHFRVQRLTAKVLLVLVPLLTVLIVSQIGKDQASVQAVVGQPVVALGLAALILASLSHMLLGLEAIIDDYIHEPGRHAVLMGLSKLLAVVVAASTLYSLFRLCIGI